MWPHGLGRGLPLQRIGLRLQLVCETSQVAPGFVAGRQSVGKLPRVVGLRSKLRRGLVRGRFDRHDETSTHCGQTDTRHKGGAIRTISQAVRFREVCLPT
jgi:hypothetical protein